MKVSKEFKIGLLVVATIFLLFFGVNYLKGINIFSPTNSYKIKLEQIDGLTTAAAVTAKGYKIGQVHTISYDFAHHPAFTVEIRIEDDLQLPVGTQAALYNSDIAGTKAIEIKFPNTPFETFYKPGDVIPGTISEGMLDKVSNNLLPTADRTLLQIDSLLREIRTLLKDESIQHSLGSLERSLANLETTTAGINRIVSNQMPQLFTKLDLAVANFGEVGGTLKKIDFQQTFNALNGTMNNLQSLTGKLNGNEGTLGLLMNDKALYNNLSNTMNSANNLLIDINKNPKRYVHFSVFGKSDKPKE